VPEEYNHRRSWGPRPFDALAEIVVEWTGGPETSLLRGVVHSSD
jgi:hypothetical protein